MKKIYGLIGFGMLVFVLAFNLVSAVITVSGIPTELPQTDPYEFNVTISSTENENVTLSVAEISESSGEIKFLVNGGTNTDTIILSGSDEIVTIMAYQSPGFEFELGKTYNASLTLSGTFSGTSTHNLVFEETVSFCEYGEKGGDLIISDFDIQNNGDGDDDEWEMFDDLEIEIEIENDDSNDEVDDVQLRIIILNDEGNDVTGDFIEDDEEIDLGKIYEDGDSESEIFIVKVTSDVDEGDYRLYVKAYEDNNEGAHCIDNSDELGDEEYYYEFEVKTEEDFKIDELTVDESMSCGSSQTVYFDLYNFNLGDDEKMRANLYSSELGIDLYSDSFELDEGKKEDLSFEIEIPEDAEEKTYKMKIYVEYAYKESSETYRETSEDTEEFLITVEGNCRIEAPLIDVSKVDTGEEVMAGDIVEVKLSLANQEDKEANYVLSAEDYSSWIKSVEISEKSVTLSEMGAKTVIYTLYLKDDLETSDYTFNMVVSSNGRTLVTQPLAVSVESKAGVQDLFDEVNWKLVGIILVNLILLIAIIVVVRKILKRK